MFDIGFYEMMLVGVVALIVVGPKDLPRMFRTVGEYVGKARGMARQFQSAMNDAARQTELQEVKKAMDGVRSATDPLNAASKSARNYAKSMMADIDPSAKPRDPDQARRDAAAAANAASEAGFPHFEDVDDHSMMPPRPSAPEAEAPEMDTPETEAPETATSETQAGPMTPPATPARKET
ncbi:Sec-independent protein translocase protein TatB [Pontivivens nitratireducens]|uniref:Sec-independent protein translocase protein TatB n=1 Tax=Pontivivens nitratireducens TaxID=2758038 RepID=A0A6G7VMB3_9RHOB|nr:Sec-independent protein translocase protein TatB [Pontibrevibacter nitratireducens]QIK40988.1 twin-arginine translocase subunit TatB [Pontibrevibacter nitratireducens]